MDKSRESSTLELDGRDFDGIQVVSLEDAKPRSWIDAILDFLRTHHRIDAVGSLTIAVLAVESRSIGGCWSLIAVVSLTVVFATFVILIGRSDANGNKTSGSDDARTSS
jgi:hypothetical protein